MSVLSKQAGNTCMPLKNHQLALGAAMIEATSPGYASRRPQHERDDHLCCLLVQSLSPFLLNLFV